jgi:hypothetical protein
MDNEVRGLGVRRLCEFNIALLGKWYWRLSVEKGSMWYKLLMAKYGEARGWLIEGGRERSVWWIFVAVLVRRWIGGLMIT